ncbi:MAG: hypothetical protein ACFFAN_00470 [Promethearchaeota archaeon]
MRILIFNDFFNLGQGFITKTQIKIQNLYKIIKLKRFVNDILKKDKEVKIKIISNREEKPNFYHNLEMESISEYRIKLDHNEYIHIMTKIVKETKRIMQQFYNNLKKLEPNYAYIFELIEFYLFRFFNKTFGEFELLKKILKAENYDKVIFYNCNPKFINFFKSFIKIFKDIEFYGDPILNKNDKISRIFQLINFYRFLQNSILSNIYNFLRFSKKSNLYKKNKKNILFVARTENQIKSIMPIYDYLRTKKIFNLTYYPRNNFLFFREFNEFCRFLIQVRRIFIKNHEKISVNLTYDSIKVSNLIKEFFNSEFFLSLQFFIYNISSQFKQYIKKALPDFVIIADELREEGRQLSKLCKKNNIPTLYIPHAALPIYDEMNSISDFTYISVAGELDKKYFIEKGEAPEKLIVTGTPRYQNHFKGKINRLYEVQDHFNKKIFKFDKNKFTVLLTTNHIDDKSNELIVTRVINALKKLDLIENLIIKLHPSENGEIHQKTIHKLNVNPIIIKDYNILELILSCDLLLTRLSTTILEAMIIGTPVIRLDLDNPQFYLTGRYLFIKENCLITAKDQDFLIKSISDLVHKKDYYEKYSKKLIEIGKKYSYFDPNEDPIEKIINLIYDKTNTKK